MRLVGAVVIIIISAGMTCVSAVSTHRDGEVLVDNIFVAMLL